MKTVKVEFPVEIERGKTTVEYLVVAMVTPGSPGKTYGPPEDCYPPEPPEVVEVSVYYEENQKCDQFYFQDALKDNHPVTCKCGGKMKIKKKFLRPEIEELVDDAEILEKFHDTATDPGDY